MARRPGVIDWCPPPASGPGDDAADGLRRHRGAMDLQRVAVRIEDRDPATAGHSERVAELVERMATTLGWTPDDVDDLRQAAMLHGLGKAAGAGADDPAPLVAQAELTAELVEGTVPDWCTAALRHQHERWDGWGGPDGRSGIAIPAGALLLAVADAFDTFACIGPYGPVRNREALDEVLLGSGARFAPWAVDALAEAVRDRPDLVPAPQPWRLVASA